MSCVRRLDQKLIYSMVLGAERHIFMLEIQISNVQDEVVVADKWLHSVGA